MTDEDKQWFREELQARLDAQKEWVEGALEAMETRLLRGFEGWVSQMTHESQEHGRRIQANDTAWSLFNTRLMALEKWMREMRGK